MLYKILLETLPKLFLVQITIYDDSWIKLLPVHLTLVLFYEQKPSKTPQGRVSSLEDKSYQLRSSVYCFIVVGCYADRISREPAPVNRNGMHSSVADLYWNK